ENLNFKSKDFVHLHLHSDYSLLQSTIQLKPLAKRLNELEIQACAITDYANLYGAVSFYNTMTYAGVRPIIGYEAMLTFGSRFDRSTSLTAGERPYYHLLLLAKDLTGYENLVYLASKAFTEGFYFKPRIDLELLAEKSSGLIAIPALKDGPVTHFLQNGRDDFARDRLEQFADIFGKENLYLEIQDGNDQLVKRLVEFSKQTGTPLVATNDAHYLNADDARAHEVLLCIGEGKTLSGEGSGEYAGKYVRSAEEMWAIFGNELSESLTNTLKIAETCALKLPLGGNLTLPTYPIPSDAKAATTNEYFEHVLKQGFEERKREVFEPMQALGKLKYDLDAYQKRLDIEIGTINQMGFAGYFLIVWDFIKYAKEKGIPVGPGRGSAAGSLAAYCMRITDVDPLQYDLLFERFLNPERISMPDIDIDFCIRGRGDVIEHVTEFYGRESVCQIITFGTMASKAAIKDVGRALNMPYGEVEKIAKMIPPPYRGRNISISQALEQVPELSKAVKTDPQVKELVDLALRLEGCARHTSVHAAGVVISPKPLHEIVPVAMSSKNELTSQYTMNDLEKVGMLKMDFLALTTLTVISDCLESLKQKTGVDIDWNEVSLNDEQTMALFGEGKTEAIFQFESSGMQEICRRLKPKELEDLSALNALYRPGPLDGGMIEDFILRHRGDKPVRYLVPQMKDILNNTYGVLVYQEQIMQLAQQLAGYSLGEADMMRRAMGKKKREEMAVHSEKFVNGAVTRGIPKAKAEEIFNLMSQFADYGFNRSHSIAYAYLAFQTAYLKAHYPAYFYASVLSHESQDSAKVYKYSNELRSIGLKLLPPDINESDDGFTPLEGAVRFGLNAIKGIGSSSVS
ncbi:MAG TPA: DNA polymerase III subunit alpha, partial [Pyrinomonadaceae bacterium]|nr:DNA polymerase III subunit alpha [Pyrinomonadaceae bacterium]